jgi:hypothetical protein
MKYQAGLIIGALLMVAVSGSRCETTGRKVSGDQDHDLWITCALDKYISFDVFRVALEGYHKTDSLRKKAFLTIIDYSKPSTAERFFVIDPVRKKLLFHSLVAHGKNSGENYAVSFSNEEGSLKSSLGFYLTAETYTGKHGYALRLDGLEKDINDNARSRDIVIHGADYVNQSFIKEYGRLGKSWGCPALPVSVTHAIIDTISHGSCLFIYGKDDLYLSRSVFLKNGKQ